MLNTILSRKSIRKFKDIEISEDQLKQLIEAACHAPTANYKQPWHFVALTDPQQISALKERHPAMGMLATAKAVIVVCGEPGLSPNFWQQDCSAASQNILLAATALGLGSCWCGVYPDPKLTEPVNQLLNLPDHITAFSAIPIGVPDHPGYSLPRLIEEKVHNNKW